MDTNSLIRCSFDSKEDKKGMANQKPFLIIGITFRYNGAMKHALVAFGQDIFD
jgi:hypothetical protein